MTERPVTFQYNFGRFEISIAAQKTGQTVLSPRVTEKAKAHPKQISRATHMNMSDKISQRKTTGGVFNTVFTSY